MKWYVYIIETQSQKLYTGITTDLARRFQEHLQQNKGAKFFRTDPPSKIVYYEEHSGRACASKREYEIKQMSRKCKAELISKCSLNI